MKVLHLCMDYEQVQKRLIEAEIANGIDLEVIHYSLNRKKFSGEEKYIKSIQSEIKIRGPFLLQYRLNHVYSLIDDSKIDFEEFSLTHAHMAFSDGYLAYCLFKKRFIPYVLTVRNSDLNLWFLWKFPRNKKQLIKTLKNAKHIFFLSDTYREKMMSRIPYHLKNAILTKTSVISNGIDNFWHSHEHNSKLDIDGVIRLITVGRIEFNKNQTTVLKAVEKLNALGHPTQYYVVGEAKDRYIFSKLSNSIYVKYFPFEKKEQLINRYISSNIYVMASYKETFGLTYVEAMSQSLPVIYTKGQGFDGRFPEGFVGYHVNPHNADEIVNAVLRIVDNYAALSSNALIASREFDWNDQAIKQIEAYRESITI